MTTPFAFLAVEWPEVHEAAARAWGAAIPDPRAACFYARRALELAVTWAFRHDRALKTPWEESLGSLIHEPTFKALAGEAVFAKARLLQQLGNQAVHRAAPVREAESVAAVRELLHVAYWFARTYGRATKPAPGIAFDPAALPRTAPLPRQTVDQLRALAASLKEKDEKLAALLAEKTTLDEELQRLRAEVAETRKANAARPDPHDYSEAQTRDLFIDLLLKEAGWPLDAARDREFPVEGMPNAEGVGFADYVLWGDDGRPLAVIEAKRTRKSPQAGQQQAKLYADGLEARFGQRPVIFYTNGYEHWLWDDVIYPPRQVAGFLKKPELELTIQRRTSRRPLAGAEVNRRIVERPYQTRAIRRVSEAFERDRERKALLVMATGAGKTRTVIALCDLLMRCGWVKRVLFLADRVALVNQAVGAFKTHLPDSPPVNLVTERDGEGRVYVSTYPTMMGLIDETSGSERRFGPGHFDLVVIDEAHRSVYRKYGAIFDYFDSLLVGLTATPKDEIDRDTYRLFDLDRGVPTDAYSLDDAVQDGFLVPARAVSVPLKFPREGITYADLPEEEKEEWDAVEWSEDGSTPARVEAAAVNRWLFNTDTVDRVLVHLMTRGQKVAGGDRLGKTIVFAANQDHAESIAKRFDVHYPHLKGEFARVVHCGLPYTQSLIDAFSSPSKAPHVAISVDMLDTGIDVPEVVNLVFFKLVRSKTKFWQMVGRGTRLRPDLFGPGQDKREFFIFDYCGNLEFFALDPPSTAGATGDSLGKRLFVRRLDLISELDGRLAPEPAAGQTSPIAEANLASGRADYAALRGELASFLQAEVASMSLDSFVVRPKRRLVEKYREPAAWTALSNEDRRELATDVAGLPNGLDPEDEEAKRFDLLMLNLQLAVLRHDPSFQRLSEQARAICGLLEEKAAIPMVAERIVLIQAMQSDEWWQDVTPTMLETARKHLRGLVSLIEKVRRAPVYTDFTDEMGRERIVDLPGFGAPDGFERFREKARAFLREHEDHVTIRKLRTNRPLTRSDLDELERMLGETGVGDALSIEKAKKESEGLGLFVRSLVGLDREAAKGAFAGFLDGRTLNASQIEFVDLIVNHLTEHGVMSPALLYESPFTDLAPRGPDGLFPSSQVDELLSILGRVRAAATAA